MTHTKPESHAPHDRQGAPPDRRAWFVLVVLCLAQFMLILDVTVVNVALPDIARDLGLASGEMAWVIAAYAVLFGGLMLLGGRTTDVLGARRVLMVGLIIFVLASLAAAVAWQSSVLLIARGVQGAAAAFLSPAALATVTTSFTGPARHKALGIWAAIGGVGASLGVLIGGLLTAGPGWRWIFGVNLPVGVVVVVAVAILVPKSLPTVVRLRLDLPGGILATVATGLLIFAIVAAGETGWNVTAIVVAVISLVLYGILGLVERRSANPLIDLSVLGRRRVLSGSFVMLAASALLVGAFFLLSYDLQRLRDWTALATGLAFLPIAVGTLIGAHLGGRAVGHLGGKVVAPVAFAIAAAGLGLIAWQGSNTTALLIGGAVAALGLGAGFVTATTTALTDVDHEKAGLAAGFVNTFHEFGGALGVAWVSAVVATPALGLGTLAIAAVVLVVLTPLMVPVGKPPAGTRMFAH